MLGSDHPSNRLRAALAQKEEDVNLAPEIHTLIVRMLIGVPVTIAAIAALAAVGSLYLRRRMR